ncbi:MAG: protein adenylyltransferase SelO [Janthinobacterium lividum]
MENNNLKINFDNSYAQLPERFYERIHPTPVKAPHLIALNKALLNDLGINLEALDEAEIAAVFSGNVIPEGADPIALAYAGHQFGHFVPQLGDGRAILLGEIIDTFGNRCDLQLKGSGQTRFSRRGDGRASLGPVMREYIISEAMHALGISTTRSLAMVKTDDWVIRETMLPEAILTRVAASHVRVGTFEFFAARHDVEALKILADYAILRHYPDIQTAVNPYQTFLQSVLERQATLMAKWMSVGFVHGVMNTDNTSISGETIDYGPCAFMESYDPETVFSSIDRHGRYAYGNQSHIAQWNMNSLATCLLPLLDQDQKKAVIIAEDIIGSFPSLFKDIWHNLMKAKIGLTQAHQDDFSLIEQLLTLMKKYHADFTLSFRYLAEAIKASNDYNFKALFSNGSEIDQWLQSWRRRLSQETKSLLNIAQDMNTLNPAFIPRNHRIEQAIRAATTQNDFSKMEQLNLFLSQPYQDQPDHVDYMNPATPAERVYQTFCGT